MKSTTTYFRLGLFVLTALALCVIGIFILLGDSLNQKSAMLETYFKYSISGLEVGSPVKFRGIPVGQVKEILLSTEAYPVKEQAILSEADAVAVVRIEVDISEHQLKEQLADYIERGLRVQTQLAGITGSLYLSIDFLNPEKYPANRISYDWQPKYAVIPSAPSLSNEIIENVKQFLADLNHMNLQDNLHQMIPAVQSLVQNLDRIAKGIDVGTVNALGTSFTKLFDTADGKINQFSVQSLNSLIAQLEKSAVNLDAVAQKADLQKLIASLTSLSTQLSTMMQNNQFDVHQTLQNLRVVSVNLENFLQQLNNNPGGLFAAPRKNSGLLPPQK